MKTTLSVCIGRLGLLVAFLALLPLLSACQTEWSLTFPKDWLRVKQHEVVNGLKIYYRQSNPHIRAVAHKVCYNHGAITAKEKATARLLQYYLQQDIADLISPWERDLYLTEEQDYLQFPNASCYQSYVPYQLIGSWLNLEKKRMNEVSFSIDRLRRAQRALEEELRRERDHVDASIVHTINYHLDKSYALPSQQLAALQRVTLSDMQNAYRKIYQPNHAFFFVTGSLSEKEYLRMVVQLFSNISAEPGIPPATDRRVSLPSSTKPIFYRIRNLIVPRIVLQWPSYTVTQEGDLNMNIAAMMVLEALLSDPTFGALKSNTFFSAREVLEFSTNYTSDLQYAHPHQGFLNLELTLDLEHFEEAQDYLDFIRAFKERFKKHLFSKINDTTINNVKQRLLLDFVALDRGQARPLSTFLPKLILAGAQIDSIEQFSEIIEQVSDNDLMLMATYMLNTSPYAYVFLPN